MSEMRHERPGVYSVYDASSVTSAGRAAKRIGVAALAADAAQADSMQEHMLHFIETHTQAEVIAVERERR